MAAARLPSKAGSSSAKDSSLFLERAQDFQKSHWRFQTQGTEFVTETNIWNFFQHFKNVLTVNT